MGRSNIHNFTVHAHTQNSQYTHTHRIKFTATLQTQKIDVNCIYGVLSPHALCSGPEAPPETAPVPRGVRRAFAKAFALRLHLAGRQVRAELLRYDVPHRAQLSLPRATPEDPTSTLKVHMCTYTPACGRYETRGEEELRRQGMPVLSVLVLCWGGVGMGVPVGRDLFICTHSNHKLPVPQTFKLA